MEDGLYICLYCYNEDDTRLNRFVCEGCVVPEAVKLRERNIASSLQSIERIVLSANSQPIAEVDLPPLEITPKEVHDKFQFICLASDGAFGQINALTHQLLDKFKTKNADIILMKYAAGTSMVQQPNDTGHMHRVLKIMFHSRKFRYGMVTDPVGGSWVQLKIFLQKRLTGPSFKTLWRCLTNVKSFVHKAFNEMTVLHAFADCGIIPFDAEKILSANPHFRTLDQAKSDVIWDNLRKMTDLIEDKGFIGEDDYRDILGPVTDVVDNCEDKMTGKDLNECSTNRQRAMPYSHPMYHANQVTKRIREEDRLAAQSELGITALAAASDQADADDQELLLQDVEELRAAKPKRRVRCGNARCPGEYTSAKGWSKCPKGCGIRFCLLTFCLEERAAHLHVCKFQKDPRVTTANKKAKLSTQTGACSAEVATEQPTSQLFT
jgi:hypothetical protein